MHPATSTEVPTIHPTLTEGQQVGGCFILKREVLEARGIRVWTAQDEVLGKEITLHFMPEAVAKDARAVSELRQEVKRNRQLIHPNILRVYDLVEDSGMVAVAMDRFEGESLASLLGKKGTFEPDEIKRWLKEIGETLNDAHRIQLFHRNLSPANFYARAAGAALVTNFGISRVITDALERAGELKGDAATLSYLSPQQLDGERVAATDDVYGLGVLAYELLAGRPPFGSENILAAIRKNLPANLNEVRSQAGRGPVPAGWERFINSCLAKSADLRPKTCIDALAILDSAKGADVAPAPEIKRAPEVKPAAEVPVIATAKPEPITAKAPMIVPEPAKTSLAGASAKISTAGAQLPANPPGNTKSKPAPTLSANYPDLERPKSKLPLIGLGVAASVLAAALYFKNETNSNRGVGSAVSRVEDSASAVAAIDGSVNDVALPVNASPAGVESVNNGDASASVPEIASTNLNESSAGAEEPSEGTVSGLIAANPPKAKVKTPPTGASPAEAAPKARPTAPATTESAAPAPAATPSAEAGKAGGIQAIALPPAPQPLPKLSLPQNADPEELSKLLVERQQAAAKFGEAATAAERVQTANAQLRGIRQEDLDEQKKTLEEKRKVLAPVIKAATDFEAEKKRLEESMAKSEAAAKEAARVAEAAKKSYEELLSTSNEKLSGMQKAEGELSAVTRAVAEGTKQVEELSDGASKAEAQRTKMLAAKKQAEQEIQQLTAALDKATKAQREAMVKANKPKISELEKQIKEVDDQLERYQKAVASLQALNDESTKDAIQRIQDKITAANAQKAEFENEIKRLSGLTPAPAPAAPAVTAPPAAVTPAPKTGAEGKPTTPVETPAKTAEATSQPPAETTAAPAAAAAKTTAPAAVVASIPPVPGVPPPALIAKVDPAPLPAVPAETAKAGANSLGMKFVPVGDVQFSVNLVTRKDFEAFAKETNLKPEHWRNPGFEQTPDHPVVNVTWKEADAFCKWLTDKERKAGFLKGGEVYRLPTDTEWSKAVGLPAESGATPEDRDMRIEDVYPWGTQWPPPAGAGNFAGEETVTELPIEGYNDKFPNTSPVGSFRPNGAGLHDMGGNVWQWVQDSFDGSGAAKTLRGGSWYNGAIKMSLLSSCRIKSSPETINDTYGFRIVKASDKGKK